MRASVHIFIVVQIYNVIKSTVYRNSFDHHVFVSRQIRLSVSVCITMHSCDRKMHVCSHQNKHFTVLTYTASIYSSKFRLPIRSLFLLIELFFFTTIAFSFLELQTKRYCVFVRLQLIFFSLLCCCCWLL